MRFTLIALAAVAAALAPNFASAQDAGSWIVRGRALHLDSANKDSTGLDLTINNKTFPELDISYFLSPNLAAELILTYPQKQTVYSGGTAIGSFKHLPPTLTAQYHFTNFQGFRPYLGAGLNYTHLSQVHWDSQVEADLQPTLKKDSFGLALQAGVDVAVGSAGWLVNLDVKKVQLKTEVSSLGNKVGTFKVDPLLVSVGVGKRF